jgi:hypothetical protein
MRQKTILPTTLILFVLMANFAHSQSSLSDSIAADRTLKNKTNMTILGIWAAINIVQGSISSTNAEGSDKAFFKMNTYFNAVNLGIAGVGLAMARKELDKKYSYSENLLKQQKLEKILLLNAGLDAAYIATGLYLKERGMRVDNPQTTGYGNSFVLQGAFLLIFDLVQYGNHRKNGKLLEKELGNWQVGTTSNGIGLTYRFK